MANGNEFLDAEAKRKRIIEVDAQEPSPSKRAMAIYSVLQQHAPELTAWDLLCFSVEYLGKIALQHSWLTDYIKPIARIVYTAHYFDDHTDTASGIESKRTDTGSESTRERKEDGPRTLFTRDGT